MVERFQPKSVGAIFKEQANYPSLLSNLRMYPLNIKGGELVKKANKFRQMMADRNPLYADLSHELYELLIKPAEGQLQGKQTLCIIPDGSLWDVPFQALKSKADRYLLEDYAVYYAPSLSVLREMVKPKSGRAKDPLPSIIAFGNPILGKEAVASLREAKRGETFDPLPEAELEVTTLERLFGRKQSKVLVGARERTKIQITSSRLPEDSLSDPRRT